MYATLQQRLLFDGKVEALESLMAEARTSTSNQRGETLPGGAPGPPGNQRGRIKGGREVPAVGAGGGAAAFPYHDTNSCNLVLTELSKRRRFDLAYAFLSLMQRLGLRADTVSYNILMDLALKVRGRRRDGRKAPAFSFFSPRRE